MSEVCNILLIRPPTAEISVPETAKILYVPEVVQTCLKTPCIVAKVYIHNRLFITSDHLKLYLFYCKIFGNTTYCVIVYRLMNMQGNVQHILQLHKWSSKFGFVPIFVSLLVGQEIRANPHPPLLNRQNWTSPDWWMVGPLLCSR